MATTRSMKRKVAPYSVHSEKALLADVLRNPEAAASVRGIIKDAEDFFSADLGRLYFGLLDVRDACESPDASVVIQAMRDQGLFKSERDEDRLLELTSLGPSHLPADEHATTIADKAAMRRLIHLVSDILHEAYHSEAGYKSVLAFAREHLNQLDELDAGE